MKVLKLLFISLFLISQQRCGLEGKKLEKSMSDIFEKDVFVSYKETYSYWDMSYFKGEMAISDEEQKKPPLPPEKEKKIEFEAPEGSENFVYIINPASDSVIKIDSKTLNVTLIEVGDNPKILRTIPNEDAAVVLNAGSDDITIIRSTTGKDYVKTLDIIPNCNQLFISPDGKNAIAIYNNEIAEASDEVGSFQSISLIKLEKNKEKVINVSVGFRPIEVEFSEDGKYAFIITEDGVSKFALDSVKSDSIVPPIPLSSNPLEKVPQREVNITPDGLYAVVLDPDKTKISIVSMDEGTINEVELGGVPTDVDIVPDSKRILAVLRDESKLCLFEIADIIKKHELGEENFINLPYQTVGLAEITKDSKWAVLYSSVLGIEEVSTLNLNNKKISTFPLKKSVEGVIIPAKVKKAIIIHKKKEGIPVPGENNEEFIDKSEGFTMFDIEVGYVKLEITDNKPGEIAFTIGNDKAYMILPDVKGIEPKVLEINMSTFMVKPYILGSQPEHIRSIPASETIAVSQKHPSGRITFINVKTGEMKTITGFELNGLID